VVDAETREPIKGAAVMMEWTETKGTDGQARPESTKVVEVMTDNKGKFEIPGRIWQVGGTRHLTMYKKGYVGWSSDLLFPSFQRREDFRFENKHVYELEYFKPEYTYGLHTRFIHRSIMSGLAGEKKKLILNEIQWEEEKAAEESMQEGKNR
jgi:hypothetical protein